MSDEAPVVPPTTTPSTSSPLTDPADGGHAAVSLSQVLAALSHALDLTEGQPAGHTLRSCAIGMRLAEEEGMDDGARSALYYALLLKDAGCSSNAERFATLFGAADQAVKYRMKLVDWHHRTRLALRTAATTGMGRSPAARVRHFVQVARTPELTRAMIRIRCDRGASIALQLGFPAATADVIRSLDEHWNGRGYPAGRSGEEIPLGSRIAGLAQTVEIFHGWHGRSGALRVARRRRGTWFDPRLVDRFLSWERDDAWWAALEDSGIRERVVAAEPGHLPRVVDDAGLDGVALAFAGIVDAKSPFTFRHSTEVARLAVATAAEMGMDTAARRRLHRAGLLHDIGKLGISSRILEKAGPLTPAERREVEEHPRHGWEILRRVEAFGDFARMASLHHEKLDGSGYPWGVHAEALEPAARILCVADIYEALTADRPYRAGMTPAAALAILRRDAGPRLWDDAVDALASHVGA